MIQRCWGLFRQVRGGLRTKAKLWDSVRSLFKVLVFPTMEALYRFAAGHGLFNSSEPGRAQQERPRRFERSSFSSQYYQQQRPSPSERKKLERLSPPQTAQVTDDSDLVERHIFFSLQE